MKAKTIKRKQKAVPTSVQSRDEVMAAIKRMGDLSREREQIQADMNNDIANRQEEAAKLINPIDNELANLEAGVMAYCTCHRDALTNGGKVKYADLITGKVAWRNHPPKVVVRGAEMVIALMEQSDKLKQFVRTKKEVNKDAVLNEAAFFAEHPVQGLKIENGKEYFIIEPYNQHLPDAPNTQG